MSSFGEGMAKRPVSPLDSAKPITESDRRADAVSRDVVTEDEPLHKDILVDFENAGIAVTKIERLSNPYLKKRYITERELFLEQTKGGDECDTNERYLYHGTPGKKLEYICREGLDPRLGKNGCFGRGIYFSDQPEKCAKYAEKKSEEDYFILLVRVLLGESKVYPKGEKDQNLKREPVKDEQTQTRYDSVEGIPRHHREFVVYETRRTLPEAIITYTRPERKDKLTEMSGASNAEESGQKVERDCANESDSDSDNDDFIDDASTPTSSEDEQEDEDFIDATSDFDVDSESDLENEEFYLDDEESDKDQDVESEEKDNKEEERVQKKKRTKPKKRTRESTKDYVMRLTREFAEATGVTQQHVIDHCLLKGNLKVDEAVNVYNDMQNGQHGGDEEEDDSVLIQEDSTEEKVTVPNSEGWNKLSEAEKQASINTLIERFIFITGLESETKTDTAKKWLERYDHNLNLAIYRFYEIL